jgi:hypothetical protein
MISFRIDTKLLDRVNGLKESKTDVIHKALDLYLQSLESVNTSHKESVNTVDQPGNREIQVIENYELMEYLKRDHDWLKDRIEHFENTQDKIFTKIDTKTIKETELSWYRM